MKLEKFWVVVKPTHNSIYEDICFEVDVPGFCRQFLGGLTAEEVYGIYTDEAPARRDANKLLKQWLA